MRMRFSEMMGSGGERAPRTRTRSETDTGVADAPVADVLAPYLDAEAVESDTVATDTVASETSGATPGTTEPVVPAATSFAPVAAPLDVAPPLEPAPVRRAWPVERPVPVETPVEAIVASAAPEPIADFTPLSDDLLPHRR
jgi:hypothetical protein